MNTADLEKYGFSETDADIICEDDLFFIEHHENLFYMNPLELAKAINAMGEDELLQFNHKTWGAGYNAELMRKKINDLAKYVTINPAIFGEAVVRNSIFEKWEYTGLKEMYQTKTKPRHAIFEILFCRFPQFRTHYSILESNGIIRKKENGCLEWTLSKISLAQYFECLENNDQRRRWSVIEKTFEEKNPRQYSRLN